MFRTEIIESKNIRKSIFYKITNVAVLILVILLVVISLNIFGKESPISVFYRENFDTLIRPFFLIIVVLSLGFSMYAKFLMGKLKRIGTLEMNEQEIKFMVEDEVKEIITLDQVSSIELEYYSMRMRNNPYGSMNYITLHTLKGIKTYEIVIGNSLEKSELGDLLRSYQQKIPVKINYSVFLRRLIGDKDFKFN